MFYRLRDTPPIVQRRAPPRLLIAKEFRFRVDHDALLSELVARGGYTSKETHITRRYFPWEKKGVEHLNGALVHFDRTISVQDAMDAVEEEGFDNSTLDHMLHFGTLYSPAHLNPVVALASITRVYGDARSPYIRDVCGWRELTLYPRELALLPNHHVLAVEKQSPPH